MDRYQEQDANRATYNLQNVDGIPPNLWELPDERSNVAVQYATAMAYPTPLFVFRIVRNEAAFTQFLYFLLGMQPVPRTVGISFNYFLEQHLSTGDADRMCDLLQQFGARGSSVLVASGDNGVGPAEGCHLNRFHVGFPSSCPWVTSVGGTQNLPPEPEVAMPRSGGGFSSYYIRPQYQVKAMPIFFHNAHFPYHNGHDSPHYNSYGRGYPDISAQAFGCRIYLNGQPAVASGTACAVSTAAGIISLLNDYMIKSGPASLLPNKAPLGFLNPWLYSDEVLEVKGLNDIVAGSNPGCGSPGFTAVDGWDPVTGLGTLNFTRLLYLLKKKRFFALTPTSVPTPS